MGNKTEYRKFTDRIKAILGDVNWGMLGRMAKCYRWDFIVQCAKGMPANMYYKHPVAKTKYLYRICEKEALHTDIIAENKDLIREIIK